MKLNKHRPAVVPVMAAVSVALAYGGGAAIHVSAEAQNGGDGSTERPFKSLADAIAAARKTPGPDEIVVAGGRYFVDETIRIVSSDSALVIRAATPGKAVFSGGVKIGGWTPAESSSNDVWTKLASRL